jgi:tellurite resistance protein TehA-like permease
MVSGMAVFITLKDAEAEDRFKKWVLKGNERSEAMGLSSLGLTAKVAKISERKYLFLWEHLWIFSMSWVLRLMLWRQFKHLRKRVKFERVKRMELVSLIVSRGLKE